MNTNYGIGRKMGETRRMLWKKSPLQKWVLHMPQYHNPKFDRYRIETKPKIFLRRWFPYFVGNNVAFLMRITDPEQVVDSTTLYVFEVFGDRERRIKEIERQTLPEGWIPILGNPIEREGDVIYSVGSSYGGKNTVPLFTAHVINTDRWSLGCIGFILGTISSVIAGIIIAFINVRNPAWDMWVPDFIMDWLRRFFH